MEDKLKSLIEYVQAEGRVCPAKWNEFWEMLPNKRQKLSGGWIPPLPLIFAALYLLAAGYTVEEVFNELNKSDSERDIDSDDYGKALENEDSKRRFYVVDDDLELQSILNAPLDKWRVFLHPTQRKLVEKDWNGPVRVLGGAGTGKTVVAMHRAKWLAENMITEKNDKILFTTFTRNLAEDIKTNLKKICPVDSMKKIEVVNLDRWVADYLKGNGYKYEIDYGKKTEKLWEKAMAIVPSDAGLSDYFYREEWEKVIQAQGVDTFEEYCKVSRVGRGTKLTRKLRKDIWPVFEEYRIQLNENRLKERDDAIRDALQILQAKGNSAPYGAIIVDEAQDMGEQAFKLIRQLIPGGDKQNDIFIVGDAHQRIYKYKVVLGQCGINIRGRGRKLRINYRTTEETKKWALGVLKGIKADDLDGGIDSPKGYRSLLHGTKPILEHFDSYAKEVGFIEKYVKSMVKQEQAVNNICLVVRTNKLLEQYKQTLAERGIKIYKVRRSEGEDRTKEGLRIATMHRVKGLEFDHMLIAGVNDGVVPLQYAIEKTEDPVVRRENETIERALLYVSATRAKKDLVITSHGSPSKYIN